MSRHFLVQSPGKVKIELVVATLLITSLSFHQAVSAKGMAIAVLSLPRMVHKQCLSGALYLPCGHIRRGLQPPDDDNPPYPPYSPIPVIAFKADRNRISVNLASTDVSQCSTE